jgi:hypothetical protein
MGCGKTWLDWAEINYINYVKCKEYHKRTAEQSFISKYTIIQETKLIR